MKICMNHLGILSCILKLKGVVLLKSGYIPFMHSWVYIPESVEMSFIVFELNGKQV